MELEVGDVVLCTVDRIVGTVVFVNIHGNGEGNIVISEIAPGRIRTLKDYVVPKKKIVCKVLRISEGRINLSLRRVTSKEKKEVMDQHKQERSFASILKTVLKDKSKEILDDISKKETLYEFVQDIKQNPKKLEDKIGKTASDKVMEILNSQKQKKAIIKREISLTTINPRGLETIKTLLGKIKDAEIKYLSAGKYSVKTEDEDLKKADQKIKSILEEIEKLAKKNNTEFKIKEK